MRSARLFGYALLAVGCGKTTTDGDSADDGTAGAAADGGDSVVCSPAESRLRPECDDPNVLAPGLSRQILDRLELKSWSLEIWDGHVRSPTASLTWTFEDVTDVDGLSCVASADTLEFIGGGPIDFGKLRGSWTGSPAPTLMLRDGFQLPSEGLRCLAGGQWPTRLLMEDLALAHVPSLAGVEQVRALTIQQTEPLDLTGVEKYSVSSLYVLDAPVRSGDPLASAHALSRLGLLKTSLPGQLDLRALALSGLAFDESSLEAMPLVGPPKTDCAPYSALSIEIDAPTLDEAGETACDLGWSVEFSNAEGHAYSCKPPMCE